MKTKILNFFLLAGVMVMAGSCDKTYTCQCTSPDGSASYTTGQVKAPTKKKAESRCSGSCSGGTISVK